MGDLSCRTKTLHPSTVEILNRLDWPGNVRQLENTDASLVIQADEHAYSGTVVKVMDAAKGAGVKNIALAAEKK